MAKYCIIYIFLAVSICGFSQKTIEEYKTFFDKYMSSQLDTIILKQINCESYLAKGLKDTVRYAGDYKVNRNTILNNLDWIGFFYSYFSKELNYEFHYYLTLNIEKNSIGPGNMLGNIFPECIRQNEECKLISRDSAIVIAQKSGIKYPYNVYVDLVKPHNSNDFFWAIDSQDTTYINYNRPTPNGLDYPIMPWKEANTRVINATTGQVIRLNEYYILDK